MTTWHPTALYARCTAGADPAESLQVPCRCRLRGISFTRTQKPNLMVMLTDGRKGPYELIGFFLRTTVFHSSHTLLNHASHFIYPEGMKAWVELMADFSWTVTHPLNIYLWLKPATCHNARPPRNQMLSEVTEICLMIPFFCLICLLCWLIILWYWSS